MSEKCIASFNPGSTVFGETTWMAVKCGVQVKFLSISSHSVTASIQTNVLWCFSLLHFTDNVFIFFKLEVCGNPASSKSISITFPTAFAHFLSLCHILVTLPIFQTFKSLLYLSQWSVIFFKKIIYLAAPGLNCSIQDLFKLWHVRSSSLTGDWSQASWTGAQNLSHCTTLWLVIFDVSTAKGLWLAGGSDDGQHF